MNDQQVEVAAAAGGRLLLRLTWGLLRVSWRLASAGLRMVLAGGFHWLLWAVKSPTHALVSALAWLVGALFVAQMIMAALEAVGELLAMPGRLLYGVEAGIPAASVWLIPLLASVALLPVALLALRTLVTWRTARSRVAYVVLGEEDGETTEHAVTQFIASLSGMRRRFLPWLDANASAFRIRLTTTTAGTPLMLWELPRRSAGALQAAVAAYPGCELVPAEEYPGAVWSAPGGGRRHSVVRDLAPASEARPLRKAPHGSTDPLGPIASVLGDVEAEHGDRLEVCVDLLPLSPSKAARWRRRQLRSFGAAEPERWPGGVASGVMRRGLREDVWSKLNASSPLFALQIVARAESACNERSRRWLPGGPCCMGYQRAQGLMARAVSTFDQHSSGTNHIRSGLASRLPFARRWVEIRIRQGVMW